MDRHERGAAVVCQPGQGESFWQPVPANGYAEVRVSRRDSAKITGFSSGIQLIAPGCHIREHQHDANEELLFFFEGSGKVLVNGEEHPIQPGTTVAELFHLKRFLIEKLPQGSGTEYPVFLLVCCHGPAQDNPNILEHRIHQMIFDIHPQ